MKVQVCNRSDPDSLLNEPVTLMLFKMFQSANLTAVVLMPYPYSNSATFSAREAIAPHLQNVIYGLALKSDTPGKAVGF
jgi:hypothetical protein